MVTALLAVLKRLVADRRPPDLVIGGEERPYMRRWYVIPRNRFLNIYLHNVLRDDDDRALHDHPWVNGSIVLAGGYFEWMPREGDREFRPGARLSADGSQMALWRGPGSVVLRRAATSHRLALPAPVPMLIEPEPTWTLFITGPRVRVWGFRCPQGFRPWHEFTGPDGTTVGKGCGE